MTIIEALKKLVVSFGGAKTSDEVKGENIAEVIDTLSESVKTPSAGGGDILFIDPTSFNHDGVVLDGETYSLANVRLDEPDGDLTQIEIFLGDFNAEKCANSLVVGRSADLDSSGAVSILQSVFQRVIITKAYPIEDTGIVENPVSPTLVNPTTVLVLYDNNEPLTIIPSDTQWKLVHTSAPK